jgi:hypothetical protein
MQMALMQRETGEFCRRFGVRREGKIIKSLAAPLSECSFHALLATSTSSIHPGSSV